VSGYVSACLLVRLYSHECTLSVEGAAGGRWTFPLQFTADEPEADEIIYIQADQGLHKLSTTSFYLSSYLEWVQWLLSLHLVVGAAGAQWKIGDGSFVQSVDQNFFSIFTGQST